MPFDYGLRLNNRQRIANAREKPIEAYKNQSVDGAEGLFLWSGSPQNVYLLPQRQNFRLERCPRQKDRSRRALLTHRAPPSGQTSCDERFSYARRPTRSHYYRSTTIQTMGLTRSLIPRQHRPILDQLLVRLSLRQGQSSDLVF